MKDMYNRTELTGILKFLQTRSQLMQERIGHFIHMEQLFFSLNATVPIFLVMVVGYILRQIKMLDEPFVKTLNTFNYKITLPVLVFQDIALSNFREVWDTGYVLFCFLATLTCIIVIWILTILFYPNKDLHGEFVQASYRSSAAVLGIAFIQNIYGSATIAPMMIIGTVPLYNVAAVLVLSFLGPDRQKMSKSTLTQSVKGILTNPIILGIAFGILASLLPFSFPVIVTKTMHNIAVLATPLALIGLGAGFEGRKALAQIKPTILSCTIKLIIQPMIFLPLAIHFGFRNEHLVAILIMLAAPTTVSCYIMAKNMNHEGTLTSSVVVATTFLSSVTLTGWLFLLRSLGVI